MDTKTRRDAATTTVGAGLTAGGADLRRVGVRDAVRRTQPGHYPFWHPTIFRHTKVGRARWATGALLGTAGVTGMGVGMTGLTQDRRRVHKAAKQDHQRNFLTEGFVGTTEAVRNRAENARKPAPLSARLTPAAVGLSTGGLASHAARRLVLSRSSARVRGVGAALAGAGVGVSSMPLTNRVMRHTAPGYQMVAGGGVKRVNSRKQPVRSSKHAQVVETRSGKPGALSGFQARAATVPSDRYAKAAKLSTDYPGYGMSGRQKRAAVYAAGGVPVVGPLTAAGMAGHLAPPEQRRKAAATQYAGAVGGKYTSAAAGALGAAALARKVPAVAQGAEHLAHAARRAKQPGKNFVAGLHPRLVPKQGPQLPGPERAARFAERHGAHSAARATRAAARPFGHSPTAALVGAASAGMAGGYVGGYKAMSMNLNRENRRNAKIGKAQSDTGMSRRQEIEQLRRKRHNAALSTLGASTGAVGTGTYAGSLLSRGPKLKGRLSSISLGTAIAGGGIGSVGGFRSASAARRDIHARERALGARPKESTAKALLPSGAPRIRGYRRSYIGTRRYTNGSTKVFRVRAGVA